ncbi:MAG: pilus assembly protein [Chloroflexi bacterium]|nr:pilus assembly protein [Chloroflexota bacterium]
MARSKAPFGRWLRAEESGSALIEAALVLPVVLVIASGVVMAGRVAHARIGVEAAAREAGRALAGAPSATQGLREGRARALDAANGYGLGGAAFRVELDAGSFARGSTVRARAACRVELWDLPLLGRAAVTVAASHEERVELYRSRAGAAP